MFAPIFSKKKPRQGVLASPLHQDNGSALCNQYNPQQRNHDIGGGDASVRPPQNNYNSGQGGMRENNTVTTGSNPNQNFQFKRTANNTKRPYPDGVNGNGGSQGNQGSFGPTNTAGPSRPPQLLGQTQPKRNTPTQRQNKSPLPQSGNFGNPTNRMVQPNYNQASTNRMVQPNYAPQAATIRMAQQNHTPASTNRMVQQNYTQRAASNRIVQPNYTPASTNRMVQPSYTPASANRMVQPNYTQASKFDTNKPKTWGPTASTSSSMGRAATSAWGQPPQNLNEFNTQEPPPIHQSLEPERTQGAHVQESSLGKDKGQAKTKPDIGVRIVQVSISTIKLRGKSLHHIPIMFEVIGQLDSAVSRDDRLSKNEFQLKDETGTIKCSFFEIDQTLPRLIRGKWHRCVGHYDMSHQSLKCVAIRPANDSECHARKTITQQFENNIKELLAADREA